MTDWQARIDRIVGSKVRVEEVPCGPPFDGSDGYPPDRREHPLAGCRRRHTKGEFCLLGCSCPCHEKWVDMGPPVKTLAQLTDAIERGEARAAADLAALPPDDGTVTVSVPDASKTTRDHFKLCRGCSNTPARCTC